jgi:hypothetical protein
MLIARGIDLQGPKDGPGGNGHFQIFDVLGLATAINGVFRRLLYPVGLESNSLKVHTAGYILSSRLGLDNTTAIRER